MGSHAGSPYHGVLLKEKEEAFSAPKPIFPDPSDQFKRHSCDFALRLALGVVEALSDP